MAAQGRTAEQLIERIATKQHGVVARSQLLSAGVSRHVIRRCAGKGSLLRVHRGVYRVGHRAPSIEARNMAAVLACGEGAVVCGRAAAFLWRLVKGGPPAPEIAATTERRVPGLAVHRWFHIDPGDRARVRGIPLTSVARTLVDLAAALPLPALARACHEAGVLYDTTPEQVEAALERRSNAPGAGKLRRVIHGDVNVTLSALERAFLRLLRRQGLPIPVTNQIAGSRRVDCRWPAARLTVELDGYRYHRSRHAWEQDRRRERESRARGDEFRRYTWGDVVEDPTIMLAELQQLLASNPD